MEKLRLSKNITHQGRIIVNNNCTVREKPWKFLFGSDCKSLLNKLFFDRLKAVISMLLKSNPFL